MERDGREEPFFTEDQSNGVRVYIGASDRFLEPGIYTYSIQYRTDRQLGFFENHDELYWNVTGTGWNFPIDRVSATVTLPQLATSSSVTHEAFTGPQDAKGRQYKSSLTPQGGVVFETTESLDAFEGLTIVVGFPKGWVREPTPEERRRDFLAATPIILAGGIGTVLVLIYYLVAWALVGHDPEEGTIVVQYEPPFGLAPAAMRYLDRMKYDNKCFAVSLINMGVKGFLRVRESEGEYTVERLNGDSSPLSKDEQVIAKHLLSSKKIRLTNKQHTKIRKAIRQLKLSLKAQFEGTHFLRNKGWVVPGLVLSGLILLIATFMNEVERVLAAWFLTVWLGFWSIGCFFLVTTTWKAWKAFFQKDDGFWVGAGRLGGALFITAFTIPFLCAEILALAFLAYTTTIYIIPLILALAGITALFFYLMKRPTGRGRRVLDQIEGFRRYLAAVEADPLQRLHPPEKTPELFEKYLPYAVALDVEHEWSEQFTDLLTQAAHSPGGNGYQPAWYQGALLTLPTWADSVEAWDTIWVGPLLLPRVLPVPVQAEVGDFLAAARREEGVVVAAEGAGSSPQFNQQRPSRRFSSFKIQPRSPKLSRCRLFPPQTLVANPRACICLRVHSLDVLQRRHNCKNIECILFTNEPLHIST